MRASWMRGETTSFGIAAKTALVVGSLAIAAFGCHALLSLDDYQLDQNPRGADAHDDCNDPAGFGGKGCGVCPPVTDLDLLNACARSECVPFDNAARIVGFGDGGLRPLPDAGPDSAADAPADSDGGDAAPDAAPDATTDAAPDGGDAGSTNPRCRDLSPRPVYVHGSSAMFLAMKTFAQSMSKEATLVYRRDASCNGLDAILTGDTRLTGSASYWRADRDDELKCDIEAGGQAADVGMCDVFPETCMPGSVGLPDFVGDFTGPVQVFMFTVPKASSQRAISAEAAFNVFGFGNDSQVAPWNDETFIFKRFEKSGNQLVLSASIDLPPLAWRGQRVVSSSDMKPKLLSSPQPEKTIGITSADVADDLDTRSTLRTLAYRHYGQKCAFLPDSDQGSYDKANVRDGHYYLWAPLHFYARVKGGVIEDPVVRNVVNYLTGAKPLPDRNTDAIGALKRGGLVPRCAMRVVRAKEGGAQSPVVPRPSCGCYFEAAVPSGGAPGCKACTLDTECPSDKPSCNFGYCEVQ